MRSTFHGRQLMCCRIPGWDRIKYSLLAELSKGLEGLHLFPPIRFRSQHGKDQLGEGQSWVKGGAEQVSTTRSLQFPSSSEAF
jgi:hypothetical protein